MRNGIILKSSNYIFYWEAGGRLKFVTYTICIMPRLRLGPENESLKSISRSIITFKFVFVVFKANITKNQNKIHFFKLYVLK